MASEMKPGAYDQLITAEVARAIHGLPAERVLREVLEDEDAPVVLSRHLQFLLRRILRSLKDKDSQVERIRFSNQVINALRDLTDGVIADDDLIEEVDTSVLWGIAPEAPFGGNFRQFESPSIRLSESALLINARNQPSIGHELVKELTTADQVDLLCSFVMNSGLNVVERGLSSVIARGGRVRVLTTIYMGATQKRAIDRLVNLGAEVRISYDLTTTRLHAKSWLLGRHSGATTAYVGSSNLSHSALIDGLEWNLRISAREQPHIVDTIRATFEDYWNDKEFESYLPERDGARLAAELGRAGKGETDGRSIDYSNIDVSPRPYQQDVLDQLDAQRQIHGEFKNLIVMATGTGKTVVAGLDYRRLFGSGSVRSLLFVAHRQEILKQSLATFRTIMRDGSFGELFVDGDKPVFWNHVFGSVQSLGNLELSSVAPTAFDMIIVDEFHHAAAATYGRLLEHFQPKVLVGLTATPERADGQSILEWFDGKISAELRLWEAIDRQILSPFQYFGVSDNVNLAAERVTWKRGLGYDRAELSNIYTGNDARVALILEQLSKYSDDLSQVKALGFCVSVEHAVYMAERFTAAGIASVAVTSKTPSDLREKHLRDLRSGDVHVVFAVDIFNEGVDIPDINTLLMLRPTESGTVFIQQLGRGLRKSEGKRCLTVLDFVGHQHKNFRFEEKYGALFGMGRRRLVTEVEDDFPLLPSGCHFELDRVAREVVLQNLRDALGIDRNSLVRELKRIGDVDLGTFLVETGVHLEVLYRNERSFTALRRMAFVPDRGPTKEERQISKALGRILHIDDPERIEAYKNLVNGNETSGDLRWKMMLGYSLFGHEVTDETVDGELEKFRTSDFALEFGQLLNELDKRRNRVTHPSRQEGVPLHVHARYSRAEILAAFGVANTGSDREGVRFCKDVNADLAFVTLNKTERHFSPSTMYADTAISSDLFQWESQSKTALDSPVGRRYLGEGGAGWSFHLFVREFTKDPESRMTMPYFYFGRATHVDHSGSKPIKILWKLEDPIPSDLLMRSKVIAS